MPDPTWYRQYAARKADELEERIKGVTARARERAITDGVEGADRTLREVCYESTGHQGIAVEALCLVRMLLKQEAAE